MDSKFFTNEEGKTLLDRFRQVLKGAEFFDILVGFFRASGFFRLAPSLEDINKIRILVGINVDKRTYNMIQRGEETLSFGKTAEKTAEKYIKDIEESDEKKDIEEGIKKFIEFIRSEKMKIKTYPNHKIHAKVYIIRYGENLADYGRVITGSSNFSESGFVDNLEFNVELKDSPDVKFALEKFEQLWEESVDVSEAVVDAIKQKTYLNDQITPYELYLKFLYEYFKEIINLDIEEKIEVPAEYLDLEYQKDAVVYAREILKKYNGVFISDVVGLGKTYIAALLAKLLTGRSIVITPPILKPYWEEVFREFGVKGHYIESYGSLNKILENVDIDRYSNVFIDESHLFRNQITENFLKLHEVCIGKKVILVSATPINNSPQDIASQIYLFQPRFRSNLPGVKNLYRFFKQLDDNLKEATGKRDYIRRSRENSKQLRERILQHLMLRRTRTDVKKHYKNDLKQQGIKFPEVKTPTKVYYQFTKALDNHFNKTIDTIKNLHYARYQPSNFLKGTDITKDLQSAKVSQGNLIGFIKSILLKRLESSFYAFKKTLERVLESHEKFLKMVEETKKVYISKKVNIFELLNNINEDNADEIIKKAVESKKNTELLIYKLDELNDEFIPFLKEDIELLKKLKEGWDKIEDNDDTKIDELTKILEEEIKIDSQVKSSDKKVVIFTESKETADYLGEKLSERFGKEEVISVSSGLSEQEMTRIRRNFDPLSLIKEDKINILITTDVLSEGVNLHRANIIINYDIPWNSTKILQRVGRVNRIGAKHNEIYIYNFFPTKRTSDELSLEKLAIAKMQAFQEAMGEDAQYLTDEEEVKSHELFGKINSPELSEGEESPELKYLNEIRKIRDKDKFLFQKIKELPKKARTAKDDKKRSGSLITFFRQGAIKRFFISKENLSEELDFYESAKILKAKKETSKRKITDSFYPLLELNKKAYEESLKKDKERYEDVSFPPNSNEHKLRFLIKSIKNRSWLTETDKQHLDKVNDAITFGYLPKKKLKDIRKLLPEMGSEETFKEAYGILVNELPLAYLNKLLNEIKYDENTKREVILSEELI
jgi:superfamily II DNA/RNA helicase